MEEKHIMSKNLFAVSMLALTVAVAPACATKKFVRGEVGNVNTKVDTLNGSLEETQERTRKNEERIGTVDTKAEAAGRSAQDARGAADAAANSARQVGTRVDQVQTELTTAVAASRKLVFEVTLSEDQGNFKSGKFELPDEAKAKLDEVVGQLKTGDKNIFIEIEGHTDNVGNPDFNQKLGLERAEMVKRYLYEQHQVPLHKMNVISYGEEKPIAPNNKRDGRAQNRRVVVKVLS
jgi:outer membrane protein OmpA-like peptidoglycan-associated protein